MAIGSRTVLNATWQNGKKKKKNQWWARAPEMALKEGDQWAAGPCWWAGTGEGRSKCPEPGHRLGSLPSQEYAVQIALQDLTLPPPGSSPNKGPLLGPSWLEARQEKPCILSSHLSQRKENIKNHIQGPKGWSLPCLVKHQQEPGPSQVKLAENWNDYLNISELLRGYILGMWPKNWPSAKKCLFCWGEGEAPYHEEVRSAGIKPHPDITHLQGGGIWEFGGKEYFRISRKL